MKLFLVVCMSALALSAAAPQAQKKSASATPKAAAKAAPKVGDASKPMAIPSDAVLGEDGDYHYTDPQGKKWIYRKTPFGVTRMEDSPERAAAKAAAARRRRNQGHGGWRHRTLRTAGAVRRLEVGKEEIGTG